MRIQFIRFLDPPHTRPMQVKLYKGGSLYVRGFISYAYSIHVILNKGAPSKQGMFIMVQYYQQFKVELLEGVFRMKNYYIGVPTILRLKI